MDNGLWITDNLHSGTGRYEIAQTPVSRDLAVLIFFSLILRHPQGYVSGFPERLVSLHLRHHLINRSSNHRNTMRSFFFIYPDRPTAIFAFCSAECCFRVLLIMPSAFISRIQDPGKKSYSKTRLISDSFPPQTTNRITGFIILIIH